MTLRLAFALAAVIVGVVLILVDTDVEPEILAGVGIICAALAAVVDR